mmetsp:Transcript_41691/g.65066  ORF Transcript_41691/g.65066 Transcript_41691/m.65066 type:complete len:241 (+) Transcript_41691:397-1119(+)
MVPGMDIMVQEPKGEEVGIPGHVDSKDAIGKLLEYQDENPGFLGGIMTWVTAGGLLLFLGSLLLLYSEIKAVLIIRDQDCRRRLFESGIMTERANIDDLVEKDIAIITIRPYITLSGASLLLLGFSCLLYPMCDVLTIVGFSIGPCLLVLCFGSLYLAVCLASFWMGVVWLCTRMIPGLLFLTISVIGAFLIPTANPIAIFIWFLVAIGGGYVYFYYAPQAYETTKKPLWLQVNQPSSQL